MTNFTLQIINAYLLKIVLAQQNYHIGNFEANTQQIISAIQHAKKEGAELIIFSELCVCGYPPRDFLEFEDFMQQSMAAVQRIAAVADTIGVLIGAPARNTKPAGKDLYNAAYFLYEKEIKQIVNKTLLPTYDIFDEYRYFEPASSWEIINFKGKKWAVTLCEDIWDISDNPLYRLRPMDELMKQKPDIMVNLSASPFDYVHAAARKNIIALNVAQYRLPMLYCNTVGSQTELVFDGGSIVMDADQNIIAELPYFEASLQTIEWLENGALVADKQPAVAYRPVAIPGETLVSDLGIAQIHAALILGIRDYFAKMSFSKAIVASSGGIDSAVVIALASEALGPENVRGLLLPSAFSTEHSISDAVALAQNLHHPYDIIPIKEVFNAYEDSLSQVFAGLAFSVAEENLQSRIRGAMVMALSNKFGAILLNTSNKSELATGYGTLYGDMAGGLGVLGDLYKMQVYALARFINRNAELIPQNIIDKAPSAELRPGQKDSDSLPDYAVLDAVLYQYIEKRKGPKELIAMGFDPALVTRILKLVNTNEYKRNQFCPIIRVSPKAFGIGRRMPIVGKYLS